MSIRPLTLVFAGGGTGGHLYPAIAVADEIRRRIPNVDITFVGTKEKIESRVVPERGYSLKTIWISGFRRHLRLETLVFPLRVVVALVQSILLLRRKTPAMVVGTGGYVCGPVVCAAQILGYRTLIQEQNSYPGLTTRLLAGHADEVHLTFEDSKRYLKRGDNVWISGTPTREAIGSITRSEAAQFFQLNPAKKTLLIFGGSHGASSINAAIGQMAESLVSEDIQIIWQTGNQDFGEIRRHWEHQASMVRVKGFIERMEYAYAACDLVVCRAGATSIAELTRAGLPSVLVPYPFAAANHQRENANSMVKAGASILVPDEDVEKMMPVVVRKLINDPFQLRVMAAAARSLGKPEATSMLADAVLRLAGRQKL